MHLGSSNAIIIGLTYVAYSFRLSIVFNCRATQAVKEDGGDRGWVPVRPIGITRSHNHSCLSQSWFIGKAATPSTNTSTNPPQTPATSVQQVQATSDDMVGHSQVSPMSSAFPTMQTRA
jgi:hypothetical protein